MIKDFIITILWSLSPFGESKLGIPYGIINGLNPYYVFIFSLISNIMVYPIMLYFLDILNKWLVRWFWYKKKAIWVARRAKKGTQAKIEKYGYLGLAVFVMLPLPGTGMYAGTIATFLFNMNRRRAFLANSIGITLSSIIVWFLSCLGIGFF